MTDDIEIGKRLRKNLGADSLDGTSLRAYGEVVYVHPAGRFYTVRFRGGKGAVDRRGECYNESFLMRRGGNIDKRRREFKEYVFPET